MPDRDFIGVTFRQTQVCIRENRAGSHEKRQKKTYPFIESRMFCFHTFEKSYVSLDDENWNCKLRENQIT